MIQQPQNMGNFRIERVVLQRGFAVKVPWVKKPVRDLLGPFVDPEMKGSHVGFDWNNNLLILEKDGIVVLVPMAQCVMFGKTSAINLSGIG